MNIEVRLPQWGMGMQEGTVVRWFKHEGDLIQADEDLVEIEAAKTTQAVTAPQSGVVTGSTFSITNLGRWGIDAFTPIINPPEAAILGVGRIVEKPAAYRGTIALRHMLTLSLTHDHRLVDGVPAAAFLQTLTELLETPYFLGLAT